MGATKTHDVYPANKYNRQPAPAALVLHDLDSFAAPIQIKNHRFFHRPIYEDSIIEHLKSSLAEALELYPPVTGCVQVNEKGELYIAMDAKNPVGTPFLVENKEIPFGSDTEDLSPRLELMLPLGAPALAVKVTQFSCGTIAVASSINHQITDLRGFLDFLELWAQISRGEKVDLTKIPSDWSHNPGRFFSDSKTDLMTPPPGFTILPASPTGSPAIFLVPSVITRWKLSKSAVKQLKNDFSPSSASSSSEDNWISSGDAVAALLWSAITRARENAKIPRFDGRSTLDSQVETLTSAADGRDRAPRGDMAGGKYFGNFNPLFSTTVPRSDLLSVDLESASRVAVEIRNSLNIQLSPKALAKKIAFFEDPHNAKPPGRITFQGDVIMTNWCRFDLQGPKLDFGWGKPFLATQGSGGTYPPGYVLLTQDKASGEISVLMTIENDAATCLKADALLNNYAELVHGQ